MADTGFVIQGIVGAGRARVAAVVEADDVEAEAAQQEQGRLGADDLDQRPPDQFERTGCFVGLEQFARHRQQHAQLGRLEMVRLGGVLLH
jgi:hypothetical protein